MPACTATGQLGCETDVGPAPGATSNIPGTRNDNTAFFEDVQRGYKQYAFFTSLDFDIIPKVLTITGGTRFYHFDNSQTGSVVNSFGCFAAGPAPCTKGATSINGEGETDTYTGTRSRGNLSWHVTSDTLLYYTFSQGFRPGYFNRTSACHVNDSQGVPQYCIPAEDRTGLADEQRGRLENGVLRPPPAVQWRLLPGEMDQRAGRLLRSRPARQPDFRH